MISFTQTYSIMLPYLSLVRKQFKLLPTCILCALSFFPAHTHAAKQAEVDDSILQNEAALLPTLTRDERIAYREARKTVEDGESDIRSGEHLMSRKPSALDPNENMAPVKARGKALIEAGQAKIQEARQEMVTILQKARTRADALTAEAATRNYHLESKEVTAAISDACDQLLQACWEQQYAHILYDRLYLSTQSATIPAAVQRTNDIYDLLVKKDGRKFTMSLAQDIEFLDSPETGSPRLEYGSSELHTGSKTALLVLELLPFNQESEAALLNIKAIDWKTHTIIASDLIFVNELKLIDTEVADLTTEILPEPSAKSLQINDPHTLIRTFENLPESYLFECAVQGIGISRIQQTTTKEALIQQTSLNFAADTLLRRIYANGKNNSAFPRHATASFIVEQGEDGSVQLKAQAKGSPRVLELGTVEFGE